MVIDDALLASLGSYDDPAAGIRERFLEPVLGGSGTVAVLSTPLADPRPVGFVLCHSFGSEFFHLSRFDVVVARTVAAAGFPVLRFHGQGYGDAQWGGEAISLTSHLRDAVDAVHLLSAEEGVRAVGTMGALFGGLVAAAVADSERLPYLAMWEPVTNGTQYMRNFLWSRLFAEWAGTVEGGGVEQLLVDLETSGRADIKGFLLTKEAYDEIAGFDLFAQVKSFSGSALLLAIARGTKPARASVKLADRLRSLGAQVDVEVCSDDLAAEFGRFHFKDGDAGGGVVKVDTQFDLTATVASSTAAWLTRSVTGSE